MTIDSATLLQVDATVIVGIFIFLTIQAMTHLRGVTALLIIPFAASALAILVEDTWPTNYIVKWVQQEIDIPRWGAIAGFGYILVFFVGVFINPKFKKSHR
jgi:hypothetical protein